MFVDVGVYGHSVLPHYAGKDEVLRKLSPDAEAQSPERLRECDVHREYDLAQLDPTQRAFANRVLKWASDLVEVAQAAFNEILPFIRYASFSPFLSLSCLFFESSRK